MCLPPNGRADAMLPSAGASPPKPQVPPCDNMNRISEDMDALRAAPSSGRRTTAEYLSLCLVGFGSVEKRDALLRVVQWALEPLLLYSSFIKPVETQEFEAVVITKKQVSAAAVEEWLGLFNMGLCCIQFDAYMQADMVTCISRIHHMGRQWYGSFKAKTAARVRRDFYKEHMRETKAQETARVLAATGLAVTPRNMLQLHSRISDLQAYVAHLERQIAQRRAAHDAESAIADDSVSTVDLVRDFAEAAARENLASAYRRMQASGYTDSDIPPPPPERTPPLVYDLTSAPESPVPPTHAESSQQWHPPLRVAFIARPPPSGLVTVGGVTVLIAHE